MIQYKIISNYSDEHSSWSSLSLGSQIDQAIATIPAHTNHYNDFVDLVKKAARHNIPRGCQKEYIPGLSDESSDLLKLYDEEYNKDPFSESTIQFNSIQNSLFSTQHIVHTTMFFAYDVLKRERAEDSAYVGSFPNIII